jgi:DNA recombination protein RmuC
MTDVLLIIVSAVAAFTLVVVIFIGLRLQRIGAQEPVTKDLIAQLLRGETDLIRRAGDEQARGVRQEVAEHVKGAQDSTIKTFGLLADQVTSQIGSFRERVDAAIKAIAEKLDLDIRQMGEAAASNRETLRRLIEDKLDATATKQSEEAKGVREELNAAFHRLGGNITDKLTDFGQQQKDRLEATKQALEGLADRHEKAQEALRQSVEGRLDSIRQESASKLDEMRRTVDEKLQSTLESRLGESFNLVVEQLKSVHDGLGEMRALASNVGDLKNVLTNVKVRGTFGEVQLELLLEQFLAPDQYVRDARIKDETTERVEFAVRLPGKGDGEGVILPIDAKFPREAYDRLVSASDANDAVQIDAMRKQLQAQVRQCAKDIRDKYVLPPKTTDFAILFLPTEGLFAEVLRQPGLFDQIQREFKVTVAGPTTLCAYLNALQMGFRSLAIEKRSSEVWTLLSAVQSEFSKYNDVVKKLAKQLHTAADSVERLGQRTRVMNRTLRSVETLPDTVDARALLGLAPEDSGADDDDMTIESAESSRRPMSAGQPISLPSPSA